MASLEQAGLRGDELQGWALAFTELVNNAVEHACRQHGDVVQVRWWHEVDRIGASVIDPGECSITENDFEMATFDGFEDTGRGAGLFLIRAWVDEVRVQPGGAGGTEILIRRRRDDAPASGAER